MYKLDFSIKYAELTYYDSAVQRFNYYTPRTPHVCVCVCTRACVCVRARVCVRDKKNERKFYIYIYIYI